MKNTTLYLLLAVGALLLYADTRQQGDTAGDDGSDILSDGVDELGAFVTGWPSGAAPYRELIEGAGEQYGVPPEILAWLFWKESRYLPDVISGTRTSRVGAIGIAQFMPATARDELGSVAAALDPQTAIPGAARYLGKLYNATGSWTGALAAYNWGVGNVTRKGIDNAPPETVDYYTTILAKANATGSNYA
jgi:soluble lytic murein transglycosylase-like protein